MIILVINAGSSSLKFTLFDMDDDKKVLANGLIERIGIEGTSMKYQNHKGEKFQEPVPVKNAREGVKLATDFLTDPKRGVLSKLEDINAIGHRIVHGMEKISKPVTVTPEVKEVLKEGSLLAPLHNPHNLVGIEACEAVLPGVPNVGVFDTAFHSTMPPRAYLYGLPYELYENDHIRRYGFHGTSHAYVSGIAAKLDGRPAKDLRIITAHLGNGASITAVRGGESVDTSMGLTPLEGVIMGTRSGDIDPAIVIHLMKTKNLTPGDMDNLLNKKSGVLGLGGIGSSDLRDIEEAANKGNAKCALALDIYAYRIKKYIGSYMAALGGLDILVFTAGAGENSNTLRASVLNGLEGLGFKLDPEKNNVRSPEPRVISAPDSPVKVMVIPTNEELAIAEFTASVLKK
ncbi:MAG: acetate kinase [Deltaproteobacteria bacterium]|jgi:acetate kinase|nr:acetate kinase [Deltaproteobacteria bacterium]